MENHEILDDTTSSHACFIIVCESDLPLIPKAEKI
jgi:hypothetical protein